MEQAWYKTEIGRFRKVAIFEGISFLLLLFIAMPLKYGANIPQAVDIMGWIHGMLFISYMFTGLNVKIAHDWSFKKTALAVVASIIPFGPFILDKKILSKENEA
ncbi:MAG: DUF3817 domain-containing protein [Bacteroidetes bacterium]|nr:DUF3817 domain-containing protein [Bacteroidota bacterium]MBK8342922.1 DUF3817 domain-containing protein [Bacteroidota bacterium]